MIKKTILLLLMIITLQLNSQLFEIISQKEKELIIRFQLPGYELNEFEKNGEVFHKIFCETALVHAEPGYPLLPFFSEIVGIPTDGDIHFQLLEKHQTILPNINIYPAEDITFNEQTPEYIFYENPEIYNRNEFYPHKLLDKGKSGFLRDRNLVGCKIYPFQFNPQSREILVTDEVIFKIHIKGNTTESRSWQYSNNFIDEVGDSFFLNNDYSKKWRKPRVLADEYPLRQGNTVKEIQIIVDSEGIYQVSRSHLINAMEEYTQETGIEFEMDFDWNNIDPRNLELVNKFGTVPIYFVGESDGSFNAGDYFEFYGERYYGEECYYDDYTYENVYILKLSDAPGSRMAVENGGLQFTDPEPPVPPSYLHEVHFEEQNTRNPLGAQWLYGSHDFYREDLYFWDKITAPNLEIFPFELQYPHQSYTRHFDALISIYGSTYDNDPHLINHQATVRINSSLINNHQWAGQTEMIFQNQSLLTNDLLTHGTNYLYISMPGIPDVEHEQILLDYFEIYYWRSYKTDEDFIKFTWPQNQSFGLYQFELENFSSDDVSIYKIGASIMENLQIESFFEYGGSPYTVTFQDSILHSNVEYYAVTEEQKKIPVQIKPDIPSNLKQPSNSADYLIITASEFVNNEGTLLFEEIWEQQGRIVEIIDLQNVYDEFNNGIPSAEAIKDFITWVYNNWLEPQVTHVLLLGDGIYDERDFSSSRKYNIVPIKNTWVHTLGAIASDNWYGCIVGDDLIADVSIGRINIWEGEQILGVADKTVHYLNNPNYDDIWHSHLTFAAGGKAGDPDPTFASQSERVIEKWIPKSYNVDRVYTRIYGDDEQDLIFPSEYKGSTSDLKTSINDESIYLQFIGHGGGYIWADYNLLKKADISTLNNNNYPFVASVSCFGAAFNSPQSSCIGEEFVITPNKGAIGHIGFTGYGYETSDEYFDKFLIEAIFNKNILNTGNFVDFTKAKFVAEYENQSGTNSIVRALVHGCALIGDPMISLKLPEIIENENLSLNDYNLTYGDTLIITADVGSEISNGKFLIFDEIDVELEASADYYPIELPVNDGILSTESLNEYIIPDPEEFSDSIYIRTVKLYAYGENSELIGTTNFAIGESNVVNISIIPENPSYEDQIFISADFFDDNGIDHVECYISTTADTIPMVNIGNNRYELENPIPPQSPGSQITFLFYIHDLNNEITQTRNNTINISGSDLILTHFEITELNYQPAAKILVQNMGSIPSEICNLKLYNDFTNQFIVEKAIQPVDLFESRWEYVEIPLIETVIRYKTVVNENDESFEEIDSNNNEFFTEIYDIQMFKAGIVNVVETSNDENFQCEFPAEMLADHAIFFINNLGFKEPLNQPDLGEIKLLNDSLSFAYQIGILNENFLADSLGHFPNNKKINLKFYYHSTDSLTQALENNGTYSVYYWEESYQKWVVKGGEISLQNDYVYFEADRIGIYAVFQNNDDKAPSIDANVEGQEFTQAGEGYEFFEGEFEGGYVSKNGIISFLLTDENGIDCFNHNINLYLSDGIETTEINPDDYTISLALGHLTNVPIKYQLNLDKGKYGIKIECSDINGNSKSREIIFRVNTEFDITNIGNYPNPVVWPAEFPEHEGRTRFTYRLTDTADEILLKIYTVSGRLVKSFNLPDNSISIGYHEFPRTVYGWDCRDEEGFYLANGVYFYRFIAKKGNKTIIKTQKMAILK